MKKASILTLTLLLIPFLSGCSRIELASHFGKKLVGSDVKSVGYYKVGSPYTIKGKRYYPAVDYNYNKVGIASWYGPNFHGKMTANGEIYNQNDLTAAHKTLPLPSIVRVTNLENGKSMIARVNDRGPYAHGRIIDMSKRSAELLGFRANGVAKVRVQVLEAESKHVAEMAKNKQDTRGVEVPMNNSSYRSKVVSTTEIQKVSPKVVEQTRLSYAAPSNSFVQMASFQTRGAAMKLASQLDGYGRAQIYETMVNGTQYYRVRFPVANQSAANTLLNRVASDGYTNAIVVNQ